MRKLYVKFVKKISERRRTKVSKSKYNCFQRAIVSNLTAINFNLLHDYARSDRAAVTVDVLGKTKRNGIRSTVMQKYYIPSVDFQLSIPSKGISSTKSCTTKVQRNMTQLRFVSQNRKINVANRKEEDEGETRSRL